MQAHSRDGKTSRIRSWLKLIILGETEVADVRLLESTCRAWRSCRCQRRSRICRKLAVPSLEFLTLLSLGARGTKMVLILCISRNRLRSESKGAQAPIRTNRQRLRMSQQQKQHHAAHTPCRNLVRKHSPGRSMTIQPPPRYPSLHLRSHQQTTPDRTHTLHHRHQPVARCHPSPSIRRSSAPAALTTTSSPASKPSARKWTRSPRLPNSTSEPAATATTSTPLFKRPTRARSGLAMRLRRRVVVVRRSARRPQRESIPLYGRKRR